MNLIARLKAQNCDVDTAIKRCHGGKEMYLKLVSDFPSDRNLLTYQRAFQEGDYDVALRSVHSIKSNAASFGFTDLYVAANAVDKAIRAQNYAYAGSLNSKLNLQYNCISVLIRTYL